MISDAHVPVDISTGSGATLCDAVHYHHDDVIEFYVKNNPANEKTSAVERLLMANATPEETAKQLKSDIKGDGRTPLHEAARKGHVAVVELLLKKHASVDSVMIGGWTALHWAAGHGDAHITKMLINAGAQVNKFDDFAAHHCMRLLIMAVQKLLRY